MFLFFSEHFFEACNESQKNLDISKPKDEINSNAGIDKKDCMPNIDTDRKKLFIPYNFKTVEIEKVRKKLFKETINGMSKYPKTVKPSKKTTTGYFIKLKYAFQKEKSVFVGREILLFVKNKSGLTEE